MTERQGFDPKEVRKMPSYNKEIKKIHAYFHHPVRNRRLSVIEKKIRLGKTMDMNLELRL